MSTRLLRLFAALCLFGAFDAVAAILPSTNDLWDVSQGTVVTATSGLDQGSDGRDMFGGNFSGAPSETGNTIFADGQPSGFVHSIEWQTAAPVNLRSFVLFAAGDGPAANNVREFAQFVLKAKSSPSATNYDLTLYTLVVSNHPYVFVDSTSGAFLVANIAPVTAQYFRAEFTQFTSGKGYDGPRVLELDGFASNTPAPPIILTQPANQALLSGVDATFAVTASGGLPLSYQWVMNGSNILATETNSTFVLTNVQVVDSGNSYSVVVSNAFGVTNSFSATLTVNPSVIPSANDMWDLRQGTVVTSSSPIELGSAAQNMFAGSGPGTFFGGNPPAGFTQYIEWQTLVPVNISSFALFAADDPLPYYGPGEFYQFVLRAKSSALATNYDLLLYTFVVTNHPYTYIDPAHLALVAANINPVTAQYFRAEFTLYESTYGSTIIALDGFGSNSLTVVTQPAPQAQVVGATATFAVAAVGTDPISFQWQLNGTNIPAASNPTATNSTLIVTNVQLIGSGGVYSVAVSNVYGITNSAGALLTVLPNATHYVDPGSSNPVFPYTNWDTAATNIQDAVDATTNGDQVFVTNGIYQYGGRAVKNGLPPPGSPTNRLVVTNAITVQSVNGPASTIIQGYQVPGTTYGASAVRCVYLANGSQLIGFTLANGATLQPQSVALANNGGGAFCPSGNATLSNCIIESNTASGSGGGTYRCILINCLLTGNICIANPRFGGVGGGAAGCILSNCIITNNSAPQGGGTVGCSAINCTLAGNFGGASFQDTMTNCTLTGNWANNGGGAYQSTLNNCALVGNTATNYGGGAYGGTMTNCTLAGNYAGLQGGGVYGAARIDDCVISGNSAGSAAGAMVGTVISGGTVSYSVANNCLIVSNTAATYVGGVLAGTLNNCTLAFNYCVTNFSTYPPTGGAIYATLNNCLLYSNTISNNVNSVNSGLSYCCTTPDPGGIGNITNTPLFVNPAAGDFHLQSNSPCINAGYNAYAPSGPDLDGNPRISGGTVDIGAYEFQNPASIISYAWLQQYNLPTDGSADFLDPDHDGLNNWQEWITGTDPTTSSSVLQMLSPVSTTNPPGLVVIWQSAPNVNYYLQRATNLSAQPAFQPLATNLPGQAGTTSYTDTNAPAPGPYFYRVGVEHP